MNGDDRRAASRIDPIADFPLARYDQRWIWCNRIPQSFLFCHTVVHTLMAGFGIPAMCRHPRPVLDRIRPARRMLGQTRAGDTQIGRWMAIATALTVPDDQMPVPVYRPSWRSCTRNGPLHLHVRSPNGQQQDVRPSGREPRYPPRRSLKPSATAIGRPSSWGWPTVEGDERFVNVCDTLAAEETVTIVQAGVVPDALVARVATGWWSNTLPWNIVPFAMWDRVADPDITREGCARTADTRLIRDPDLRDARRFAAAAKQSQDARGVPIARPDPSDARRFAAAAKQSQDARGVLCTQSNLCTTMRPLTAIARDRAPNGSVLTPAPDLRAHPILDAVRGSDGSSG